MRVPLYILLLLYRVVLSAVPPFGFECRDPDLGGQIPADHHKRRKFLVVGGAGAI